MRSPIHLNKPINSHTYELFIEPLKTILPNAPELFAKGDRPLQFLFKDQLNSLIYFHLQEHDSARSLIQTLKEDEFAKQCIAPKGGIGRSSFSEALNNRGLEQLQFVFDELHKKAKLNALLQNKTLIQYIHESLDERIKKDGKK